MRPTFTPDEIDLICDKYIAQTNEAGCNPKHYDAVREALHSVLRHIVLPLSYVDPAYAAKNPLGGPAKVFRTIAERIEAGEDYDAVLRDYDLVQRSGYVEEGKAVDLLRRIAEANVIFPSMCANNMEAWNLAEELKQFISPRGKTE